MRAGAGRTVDGDDLEELARSIAAQETIADLAAQRARSGS
jgi:hypothetical protein